MDECIHAHVQSWTFEDGESARFWSCKACGRKFVPLDLAQERDAKRYRWVRENGDQAIGRDRGCGPEWTYCDELDALVDDRMEVSNG
jgi:hypothetical protein